MDNVRIGNKRDARKAAVGILEYIGSGGYRYVYADRSRKVAYKVDRKLFLNGNRDEADAYVTMCRNEPRASEMLAPVTSWEVKVSVEALVTCGYFADDDLCTFSQCPFGTKWEDEYDYTTGTYQRVEVRDWDAPRKSHSHPTHVTMTVNAMPLYPYTGDEAYDKFPDTYRDIDQTARAMFHALDVGDFHPGNYCVTEEGRVWVTDYQFS